MKLVTVSKLLDLGICSPLNAYSGPKQQRLNLPYPAEYGVRCKNSCIDYRIGMTAYQGEQILTR